jgi:hypothetical protein
MEGLIILFAIWVYDKCRDAKSRRRGFANREDEEYVEWLKECERDFEHKRHLRERYLNS